MSKTNTAQEPVRLGNEALRMSAPQAHGATRRRILIVDDEPLLRSLMARVLELEHEVVEANGGRVALATFERGERFDLVLCDLVMPDLAGPELYNRVAAISQEQADRFVFLTGGAVTATLSDFLEVHAQRRLDKPMSMQELRGAVQHWLGRDATRH